MRRFPELTADGDPVWMPGIVFRALATLPVVAG